MTRSTFARGAFGAVIVLLAVAAGFWTFRQGLHSTAESPAIAPPEPAAETNPSAESSQGFLYGRVTTVDNSIFEGRLRWGKGDQEAFWGDYFLGTKRKNPWLARVPPERLPKERHPIEIFGIEIFHKEKPITGVRPLMVRFGEIVRIEARGDNVRMTLKSGTVFDFDRFETSDFDDGVRVWDAKRGVVDLDSLRIRTIELLPTPLLSAVPGRLHGTVQTKGGDFTGFVHWNREEGVGSDELEGRAAEGELSLRFDTIRSIVRSARSSVLVTLLDGREIALSDVRSGDNPGNRGIHVDDRRYGRVLIAWDDFERVDFSPSGSGPAYGDFPPGRPLTGSVIIRDGRRLTGRLVYDLDESETTDTLDAPSQGVNYTIPFSLIASISHEGSDDQRAKVVLSGGEALLLESTGDLDERNAGLLVFVDGRPQPEYVAWADVEQIELGR